MGSIFKEFDTGTWPVDSQRVIDWENQYLDFSKASVRYFGRRESQIEEKVQTKEGKKLDLEWSWVAPISIASE